MNAARRVVIAEDESLIRLDLHETLTEEGYDIVGEAADGERAVQLVRELTPDVAILDIKMPGTDGIEAARIIADEQLCAVVILTAFSQRELLDAASSAGALAYVVKPFNRNDLVPAIEMATARFQDLVQARAQAKAATDRLEDRKLIDRAKSILMNKHAMSEDEAFKFVRSTAMSARTSMGSVALDILEEKLAP